MIQSIDDILNLGNANATAMAESAQKYKSAFEQHLISDGEYKELTDDLLDENRLNQIASSVEEAGTLMNVAEFLSHFLTV